MEKPPKKPDLKLNITSGLPASPSRSKTARRGFSRHNK
jgi:hypothetical protein